MPKKNVSSASPKAADDEMGIGPSIEVTGTHPVYVPRETTAPASKGANRREAPPEEVRERDGVTPLAFRVEREGQEALVIPLYPDRHYLFGRTPEAHIVFTSDSVSRVHGRLSFNGTEWVYRDLNSRNGSFIVEGGEEQRDGRHEARQRRYPLHSGRDCPVHAGETLLIANPRNRLVFLEELPAGLGLTGLGKKSSAAARNLQHAIDVAAHHGMPVFLLGPSGSGKTFVARSIHERKREKGQFVIINCGALSSDATQLRSEFLGHEKGAFTGAVAKRIGKMWSADQGTLFLDEVESMPEAAQDFLIDVLERSGSFAPLGAPGDFNAAPPNFRLISASKLPLNQSRLRPDLCQRLGAGEFITLPTLEERREDIPDLIQTFLQSLQAAQQLSAELTDEAVLYLQNAQWPGQVRELESTVKMVVSREYASHLVAGTRPQRLVIGLEPVKRYLSQRQQGFGGQAPSQSVSQPRLQALPVRKRPSDLTREDILSALQANGGNKKRTAEALGIALNTLKAHVRRVGL